MYDRLGLVGLLVGTIVLVACAETPADVNNLGREAYLEGDYETALQLYEDAQELAPTSGEPYYGSANVLYRMEQHEDSLEDYDESISHATGELRARAFFNRGNASFQQQQYGQAVEAYEEALRINPDDADAKHNLELALRQNSSGNQDQDEQEAADQNQDDQQAADQDRDEEAPADQNQDEQQADSQDQDQPITETQVRQLLESVGESARSLQERRGQVLVSPEPPSKFDW